MDAGRPRWLRRAAPVAAGVGLLAATAYTAAVDPNTSHAFPICPLKAVTDIDCPMCGSLRAVHSLTKGDLVGALDHNIFLVLGAPLAVVGLVLWALRCWDVPAPRIEFPRRVVQLAVGALILYGVARNLPIPGHDFLNSAIY